MALNYDRMVNMRTPTRTSQLNVQEGRATAVSQFVATNVSLSASGVLKTNSQRTSFSSIGGMCTYTYMSGIFIFNGCYRVQSIKSFPT